MLKKVAKELSELSDEDGIKTLLYNHKVGAFIVCGSTAKNLTEFDMLYKEGSRVVSELLSSKIYVFSIRN